MLAEPRAVCNDLPGKTTKCARPLDEQGYGRTQAKTMHPSALIFVFLALGLGFITFRLVSRDFEWHWGVALFLAAVPIAMSFLFGMYGLLGSALFVGALYKAGARL